MVRSLLFELPHSGIEETKKEAVSLVLETPCGFQCQRSSKSLAVHPSTKQSVCDGLRDVGFKLKLSSVKSQPLCSCTMMNI